MRRTWFPFSFFYFLDIRKRCIYNDTLVTSFPPQNDRCSEFDQNSSLSCFPILFKSSFPGPPVRRRWCSLFPIELWSRGSCGRKEELYSDSASSQMKFAALQEKLLSAVLHTVILEQRTFLEEQYFHLIAF